LLFWVVVVVVVVALGLELQAAAHISAMSLREPAAWRSLLSRVSVGSSPREMRLVCSSCVDSLHRGMETPVVCVYVCVGCSALCA